MIYEKFYGSAYQGMRIAERKWLELIDIYREEANGTYDLHPIIYTCSRIKAPEKMLEKLKRKGLEPTLHKQQEYGISLAKYTVFFQNCPLAPVAKRFAFLF